MINDTTIATVADTAALLAEKQLRLVPVEGTPLAALVNVSLKNAATVATMGGNSAAGVASFEEMLEASANEPDALGRNEHDEIMGNAVQAVSDAINFNNQLARNVVNPMIERVATRVEEALRTVDADGAMPVSIVEVFDRPFWALPYVHELFGRYDETTMQVVSYVGPAVTWDDQLVMSDVASLDEAVIAYLNDLKSEGRLEQIWNRTFGRGAFKTSDAFSGDPIEAIDTGLVTYLVAGKLAQNPPADTEMSSTAWETMLTEVRVQAGRCVCRNLGRLLRGRDRNELIRQYPTSTAVGERVLVDGEVYRRFLEAGGSPEVILGALFSDRAREYNVLLEKRATYTDRWRVTQNALVSATAGRRLEMGIIALEKAVAEEINNVEDSHLVVTRQQLHTLLHRRLDRIATRDLEDLWSLARRMICQVIFPHTDAESTLLAIDEQKRLRPELDIREAATYAAFDQLAQWLAKLIRVDSMAFR